MNSFHCKKCRGAGINKSMWCYKDKAGKLQEICTFCANKMRGEKEKYNQDAGKFVITDK